MVHLVDISYSLKFLNSLSSVTVKKEQEDVKQAALLKDALAQSEGAATQPGTSEEGIVSKKSSDASSDISEIKKAEDEHGSEVEKIEDKDVEEVDISEKERTPESTFLETSKDTPDDSEKSGQTLDITQESAKILEDSKSDGVESNSEEKKPSESSTEKLETISGDKFDSSKITEGTSEAGSSTPGSLSDTSVLSVSSSSNIPEVPTTTPSESHSDTINPQESSGEDKLMTSQSEPADSMTSARGGSDKSTHVTCEVEPVDTKTSGSGASEESNKEEPTTSQAEPAKSTKPVKDEKESGGAVAVVTSSASVEDKPERLGRESAKLTQEQLDTLFVKETQENLLGLIGAMVPKDSKVG